MMNKFDRRYIYVVLFIAVAIPIFFPFNLPVFITKEVRGVFDELEKLPEGSTLLLVFDYEPASSAELDPMAIAILRQCYSKNIKVVAMSVWIASGAGLAEKWLDAVGKEYGKVPGKDYTNLGYKAGTYAVVIGMGENLRETFPKDYNGKDINQLEVMNGIETLKDFPYMVCLHDDGSVFWWTLYGYERYGIKIGAGCTAVMAPGNYPPYQAQQLTGIIGGLKGASEYEKLMGYRGSGSAGMDSQSVIHIFIIGLLIFGNIVYFTTRKDLKK
jgi:hypothetical protein